MNARIESHSPYKKQQGVALVTALLIVSLATIMAVSLVSRQYMDVRRTGNIMSSDKAYLQALTMEASAMHLLKFTRSNLGKKYDDKNEFDQAVLTLNASALEVAEGEAQVSLELEYPEAKFNVNSLLDSKGKADPKRRPQFISLFTLVLDEIDQPTHIAEALVDSLIDWIDEDQDVEPNGAEDSVYESNDPPYKTADHPMKSISELKLIDGFTDEILYGLPADPQVKDSEPVPGLLHYLAALPNDATMSFNFLTEPKILQAISPSITKTMAENIINEPFFKENTDFYDHADFKALDTKATKKDYTNMMDAIKAISWDPQSTYFTAKSTATLGNSVFLLNSLVSVNTVGDKVFVESRAIGTDGI